ncbi:hypothetical protein [Paenibacillus luteus]|nr:hypothetical protein [Paenibacillus luteus]
MNQLQLLVPEYRRKGFPLLGHAGMQEALFRLPLEWMLLFS